MLSTTPGFDQHMSAWLPASRENHPELPDSFFERFIVQWSKHVSLVSPQKTFVVAVRIEGRVDLNQIDALGRKFSQLIEIIAAIYDSRVDNGGGLGSHLSESA